MYQTDEMISKPISTADGEEDFKVRFFRDEGVGIITTRSEQSFFLLDSAEYWYDLIQEQYPPVMKCSCKNNYFTLTFDYTPRAGTDDFKEINITCRCTACQRSKKLPPIEIDYSPSTQLFDNPITFCKQPKIKYKTYSKIGYWSQEEILSIARFFLEKGMLVYYVYWDSESDRRCAKELSAEELHAFLTGAGERYRAIYFSEEPLNDIYLHPPIDEKGISIPLNLWRKERIFMLHAPIYVVGYGKLCQLEFSSEYIDPSGNIAPKSPSFEALTQEFQKFHKKLFKK